MNTPLVTWLLIVSLIILLMLVNFVKSAHKNTVRRHRFIEIGSEREELFIPGDPNPRTIDEYDYDDCNDDDF